MRAKLIILINLLFISLSGAQDTTDLSHKLTIGSKFISENSYDYSIQNHSKHVFSGGLQLIYSLNKTCFSIESGVFYISKANQYTFYPEDNSIGNSIIGIPFPVYYHYLSVPVNLRLDTKIIYISGGVNLDRLISKSSPHLNYTDNIFYATDRNFNLALNLNIGIEKPVYSNFNVFVEGRIIQTITSSKKELKYFQKSYRNLGFAVGINYNFK